MNPFLRIGLRLGYAIPRPFSTLLAGCEPSVLMYHGVPKYSMHQGKYAFCGDDFEKHLIELKRRFDWVHPKIFFGSDRSEIAKRL